MNKLKALSVSDWIVAAGSALVFIFGLFRWFTWKASIDNVEIIPEQTSNAFDYLLTGVLPWLLLVGIGVVVVLLAAEALLPGKVPWPMVIVGVTAACFRTHPDPPDHPRLRTFRREGDVDVDVSRGIGIWMSALGCVGGLRRGVHRLPQHRVGDRLPAGRPVVPARIEKSRRPT